jgi:sarcosine oxidase subunit beta
MQSAEIVIIGGGIVGASIAWHLTQAGCTDIIVVEREHSLGKGSTGKSMGGVRAQFTTEPNIRMSMYSIDFYSRFDERMDRPAGYRPQGYLFLAITPAHLDYLRKNVALQQSLGLKTVRMMAAQEIRDLFPQLRADDVIGASFCSTDGFVDPYSVMTGFMECAIDAGVKLWKDAEVTALEKDGNGITTVRTARGDISTRNAVIACGAWSAQVAKLAGVELPVEPLRRMLVPTEPFDRFPHTAPMIIDMSNGFHFRPEGRGFLLAWNDVEERSSFNTNFEPSFLEKILTRAADRVPCFEDVPVNPKKAWAGLYEMTPDHHPVFGQDPSVRGLYYACGFSGHGVMHAPSTGKITADVLTKGKTDLIDASLFNISRFAEGKLIHETAVL